MTKSILEGAWRPKDLAVGGNHPPPPPDASSLTSSLLQHGFTTVRDCGASPQ
ncbi:MAG: hypothetical protein FWF18_04475 [Dehalococcoidia bacterium]|nr:hypothetical protein [Dehalococcoidia bacterium]